MRIVPDILRKKNYKPRMYFYESYFGKIFQNFFLGILKKASNWTENNVRQNCNFTNLCYISTSALGDCKDWLTTCDHNRNTLNFRKQDILHADRS